MKTPFDYFRAINECELNDAPVAASILLALYQRDFPEGPQPVRPSQRRAALKASFEPHLHSRNPFAGGESL